MITVGAEGSGVFSINGGISNDNSSGSTLTVTSENHTVILNGDIVSNRGLLTINSNGFFGGQQTDVSGGVDLGGSGSHLIKNIGVGGNASVGIKDTASVTVTSNIGANSGSNIITVNSGASLIHHGAVLGTLNITNNSGSVDGGNIKLGNLGDGTAGTGVELIVSGTIHAGNIRNGNHQVKGQNSSNGTVNVSTIGDGGGLQTSLTIGDGTEAGKATVKVSGDIYMDTGTVTIDVKSGSTLTVLDGGTVRGHSKVVNDSGAADAKGANAMLGIIDGSVTGGTSVTIGNDVSAASLEKGTVTIQGTSSDGQDKLYVATIGTDSAVTNLNIGSGSIEIITVEATNIIGNTIITTTKNGNLSAGTAVGNISINSNFGTASIETVGRAGTATVLTVSGDNLDVGALAGQNTTVKAADSQTGTVTLKDFSTQTTTDLGQTDAASAITLGGDGASGTLTVNLRDIVGGQDGNASTTMNLASDRVNLVSTNTGTVDDKANVSGHVNINLIGSNASDLTLGVLKAGSVFAFDSANPAGNAITFANGIEGGSDEDHATTINLKNKTTLGVGINMTTGGYYALNLNGTTGDQDTVINTVGTTALDTSLAVGGTNSAALTTITTLIGGTTGTETSTAIHINGVSRVGVTNAVTGNVDIANNSATPIAARLSEMGDGRLRVGGSGEVLVNTIDAATGLTIAGLAGEQGTVTLAPYSAGTGGIQTGSKVTLRNAVLKLAADNSGLAALGNDFSMDSTDGESRLAADGDPAQAQLAFNDAPTVTVGAGGDVVIETKSLLYNQVLQTAGNPGDAGAVYFADADSASRMVFKSSDSTNTFNNGVEIDGGNWEFEGATTFNAVSTTPSSANYIRDAEVYFTGLDDTGATNSEYIIDGTAANNTIDAQDTTLHLNKGVNITYRNKGALENLKKVVIGDEYQGFVTFSPDTILTTETLLVGDRRGRVGDVTIGGGSAAPAFASSLNVTDSTELAGKLTVDGTLSLKNNGTPATITITGLDGGFVLTNNSLNSSIEQGTSIQLTQAVYDIPGINRIHFLSADSSAGDSLAELIARMAANVTVDTSNLSDNVNLIVDDAGSIYYHNGSVANQMDYVPDFAKSMVAAADALNPILGMYLLGSADPGTSALSSTTYHRELIQIMGNTLNSSAFLVQNATSVALNHLNATAPRPAINGAGPVNPPYGGGNARQNGLWATPGYNYLSVDSDYKKGYGDFDVKAAGVTLGYDRWINTSGRLGAFFNYGRPKLDGSYQKIEADDVQFGFYGQGLFRNGFIVNVGVALGWQDYESRRSIRLSGLDEFNQDLKADYHGHSFSLALEVVRPVALENNIFLRPSLGYTFQGIHLSEIKETTNMADGRKNLAQKISGTTFQRQSVRLGTDIGWSSQPETVTLIGRAYWVANVGDKQPRGTAVFTSAGGGALPFTVRGAKYDEHMANLGLGLQVRPASARGLLIGVDYDALLGSKAISHNLGLKLLYEF
ncbi:MAG: autotransporter domain-containing protein [Planctomycetes bacterium]|nr:autotransporter domain-containing protein [Planctomycetota bacterium]